MTEKYQTETSGKFSDFNFIERQLLETTEQLQLVKNELNEEKAENKRRILELMKQLEQERDSFKQKIFDLDKRNKDVEIKR